MPGSGLREIIKNRGHFPSDEAATKLLYLALRESLSESYYQLPIHARR